MDATVVNQVSQQEGIICMNIQHLILSAKTQFWVNYIQLAHNGCIEKEEGKKGGLVYDLCMIGKAVSIQYMPENAPRSRMYISLFVFSLVVPQMGNDICRFTAAARK